MAITVAALAELVDGRVQGDGSVLITAATTLEGAVPGSVTLIDRCDRLPRLASTAAAAAIVPSTSGPLPIPAILVDDVHRAFAVAVCHFRPRRAATHVGISPQAIVSPTARYGADVEVHPGAMIGDDVVLGDRVTIHSGVRIMAGCRIGDGTTIFPNAVLYEDTVVGPRCLIHAGAVIGAYGFGYKTAGGRHELSAQLGWVELGADVEVGANATIDRGTYGPTRIGEGTKIDNLVMIAHNCQIGRHNLICSQVGVAGSTTTGDYVVMAGQVGVRDHVQIGTGAILGAKAGVTNDVPAGATVIGIPATPERDQKLKQAAFSKLPEMRRQLKDLERAVAGLVAPARPAAPPIVFPLADAENSASTVDRS